VSQQPPAGGPIRVLIADDEPDVRLLLRLSLRHHDVEIVGEAADGHEVLEMCGVDPPDVVVLDLLMPRLNGFEVILELRHLHPQIGIVAHSAVAGDVVRRQMARQGIPLVLKSGDAGPLVKAIKEIGSGRADPAADA
jgi:two-component system, NarL family, nitrate/nitrite response regulator NarL